MHRAKARTGVRFIAKVDVSRFYQSIYTHSIPWALHGKAAAKANRTASLAGNIIDKAVRESQDGQTLGLPVGPDTSFLLAELILSEVDIEASTTAGGKGWRWYDDYEIGFQERYDAERFSVSLESLLAEYELEINPEKTRIIELPEPLQAPWIARLRAVDIERTGGQEHALLELFSTAFEMAAEFPKDGVLKFATKRLYQAKTGKAPALVVHAFNWDLAENLILQTALHEPDALATALGVLSFYELHDYPINQTLLSAALSGIAVQQARAALASDTAWAIWGFIERSMPIPSPVAQESANLDDDIVGLLLLNAHHLGLIADTNDIQPVAARSAAADFQSDRWLLAYESWHKGWITLPPQCAVSSSQLANDLHAAGVNFYQTKLLSHASARHVLGAPFWLPPDLPSSELLLL